MKSVENKFEKNPPEAGVMQSGQFIMAYLPKSAPEIDDRKNGEDAE